MTDTATRTREQSKEVATEATETTKDVARSAQQQAGAVADEARQQVSEVASEAASQAKNVVHDAKQQLREQADAQAAKVSESLQRLTGEFRALCEGRPEEAETVRRYAQQASSQLDQLTSHIDERGFDGLIDDVQRFARRRPGTFLAGAAVAGFLAGRTFRSVKDDQQDRESPSGDSQGPSRLAPTAARTGLARPSELPS